jgi:hypothetical protein
LGRQGHNPDISQNTILCMLAIVFAVKLFLSTVFYAKRLSSKSVQRGSVGIMCLASVNYTDPIVDAMVTFRYGWDIGVCYQNKKVTAMTT